MTNRNSGSTGKATGLLHPARGRQKFALTRHAPADDLSFWVLRYWIVRWDLRGQPPHLQENIPFPCVNLVIEKDKSSIYGVQSRRSLQLLKDQGVVLGVKFRPGGFYPFYRKPIVQLTDAAVSLAEAFGAMSAELERTVLSAETAAAMIAPMAAFLRGLRPQRDPNVQVVNQIAESIRVDREITRVDMVAASIGISTRTLQRLFREYVGVSPKWVIRHYRLHEAAAQLQNGALVNLPKLALDLGYFDQAHFIKDFKALVGSTPSAYAKISGG
jgi:AraC-like DNA-binding protein